MTANDARHTVADWGIGLLAFLLVGVVALPILLTILKATAPYQPVVKVTLSDELTPSAIGVVVRPSMAVMPRRAATVADAAPSSASTAAFTPR
jgi:hypothetical protein